MHGPGSAAKTGAKKAPPKNASIARFQGFCCYRIRSEIRAVSGAWVRQLNGRGADGCGQKTGRLQVVCRKTAAAKPAPIRATSHEPRATSHEPRATSHEPQATSHKPQATSHKPQATSQKPQAKSQKPRPAQPHGPGFRGLTVAFPGPFPQQAQGLVSAPSNPLKPRQRAHAWPRLHCKNRSKKSTPEKASIARF